MSLSRIALATALASPSLPPWPRMNPPGPSAAVRGSSVITSGVCVQTQEDPTWQLELAAEHETGFYVGTFLSGVDFVPSGADYDDGIDYEVNAYLGWNGQLSDTLTWT